MILNVTSDQVRVVSTQACISIANPPTRNANSDPIPMQISYDTPSGVVSLATAYVNVPIYAAGTDLLLACGNNDSQILVRGGAYDGYYGFYRQVTV